MPDVQNLGATVNMRATFLAGGQGIAKGEVTARTIDLAPTLAYILGIPEPQQSQGRVLTELLKGGNSIKPISIVGLNDFHGQLDPTTVIGDNNINVPVGGASFLATMFDEELAVAARPRACILAGGDNVGRLARELRAARGHADDRRRERVGPRRHVATATTSSTTASTG